MGEYFFHLSTILGTYIFSYLIQEVQLATLTDKECAHFGKDMKVIPKIELCAGNKIYYEPVQRYVKYINGTLAKDPLPTMQNDVTSRSFYLGK